MPYIKAVRGECRALENNKTRLYVFAIEPKQSKQKKFFRKFIFLLDKRLFWSYIIHIETNNKPNNKQKRG
jgi:hypothetical protein